jgi:hypothetical protein
LAEFEAEGDDENDDDDGRCTYERRLREASSPTTAAECLHPEHQKRVSPACTVT